MSRMATTVGDFLLPVATGAEAEAFDAAAQRRGIAGSVLMESAGRSAADCVQALLRSSGRSGPVVVLAGAGNNGGDGVVLARTLHARGIAVRLWQHPRRPDPDPLLHDHPVPRLHVFPGSPLSEQETALAGPAPALFVDALVGTGLTRAPQGEVATWIRTLAQVARDTGTPVVALDLPSGVVADTGEVPGARDAVDLKAEVTVTFGALKRGLLLHPGRARAGRIVLVEVGFPPWPSEATSARLLTGAWARSVLPVRRPVTHKRAEGCLLLVAGAPGMAGAAILAARAALRAGVGLLRVACHPSHRGAIHAAVPEAVLPAVEEAGVMEMLLAQADAVVAGPGMGTDPGDLPTAPWLRAVAGSPRLPPLLLDADALTLLGSGALVLSEPSSVLLEPALGEPDHPSPVPRHLLTPHPGEMGRIYPEGLGQSAAEQARGAARAYGAVCLLKGTPSVVAAPEAAEHWMSASGGSPFAAGGMGDVLAGVAGAFMARGVPAREAAGLALHLTGRGADWALASGVAGDALLPSDLIHALPHVLDELATHDMPPTAGTQRPDPGLPASVLLDLAPPR